MCDDNLNKPFIFLPVVLSVCLNPREFVYLLTQKHKGQSKNAKDKFSSIFDNPLRRLLQFCAFGLNCISGLYSPQTSQDDRLPMRTGLRTEIILSISLLLAAALLFAGFLLVKLTERKLLDHKRDHAANVINLVAAGV